MESPFLKVSTNAAPKASVRGRTELLAAMNHWINRTHINFDLWLAQPHTLTLSLLLWPLMIPTLLLPNSINHQP